MSEKRTVTVLARIVVEVEGDDLAWVHVHDAMLKMPELERAHAGPMSGSLRFTNNRPYRGCAITDEGIQPEATYDNIGQCSVEFIAANRFWDESAVDKLVRAWRLARFWVRRLPEGVERGS